VPPLASSVSNVLCDTRPQAIALTQTIALNIQPDRTEHLEDRRAILIQ
jgi:hypothetical protein